MEFLAIVFTLISVFLHISWNLLGKKTAPSLAFFSLAMGSSAVILSPILMLDADLELLPVRFWNLVILTGLFQAIYMTSLAWAYARGEISVIYPIARSLPVILVPLGSVYIFQKEVISYADWLAFIVITCGAMLLPIDSARHLKLRAYLNPALAYALLAGLSTACYSTIDDMALRIMIEKGYSQVGAGLSYMVLQAGAAIIWAVPIILFSNTERAALSKVWQSHKRTFVLTGLMITTTYGLVLIAITYTSDVSYVVALRQLSIPLGVFLGIRLFNEKRSALKTSGTLIIVCGLLAISLM